MENYQMRRGCGRPYNTTCGMGNHIDHMEPAMAYVPCQNFAMTYDLSYALKVGTVFPQLCKPFCGKRGKQK